MRKTLASIAWKVTGLAAMAVCVWLGWMLFEFSRQHRVDNVIYEWARSLYLTVRVMFRVDPILTTVLLPFGVLVVLILLGLLIWLRRER